MDLAKLKAASLSAFKNYSRAAYRASRFVKFVLIIVGAAAVAVALAVDIAHANGAYSIWTLIGICGAFLVAVGSAFDAFRETDAAQALIIASQAIDAVTERQQELEDLVQEHGRFDKAVTRGLDLYNSMDVMRGAIEQSLDLSDVPAESIIQTCLSAAETSILGAFDFGIKDIWTICIFKAQPEKESGKVMLRAVAHLRKIACQLHEARSWPEGVGVAGIAYSMNHEIIIQDMSSADTVAMLDLRTLSRDYDKERYASMVAVPITIGNAPKPWGVAVVTSDRRNHFLREPSYGVATTEPIRAIAAMTALAVKAAQTAGRRTGPVASGTDLKEA
jgi:multidrug transporter EmrE-like cation transporter